LLRCPLVGTFVGRSSTAGLGCIPYGLAAVAEVSDVIYVHAVLSG
jgi:hypothetical protein